VSVVLFAPGPPGGGLNGISAPVNVWKVRQFLTVRALQTELSSVKCLRNCEFMYFTNENNQ
jgi:hypothetical protein